MSSQNTSSDSTSSVRATQQGKMESRVSSSQTNSTRKAYALDQPVTRGPRFSDTWRPLSGERADAIRKDHYENTLKAKMANSQIRDKGTPEVLQLGSCRPTNSTTSTVVMKELGDANIGGRVINSSPFSVPVSLIIPFFGFYMLCITALVLTRSIFTFNSPNTTSIRGTQHQQNYYCPNMGRSAMENMVISMSQPIREGFLMTPDASSDDFLWKSSAYMRGKGKGNLQLSSSSDSSQYELQKFKLRAEMAERQVEELKMQLGALTTRVQELTIWKRKVVRFMSQYIGGSSS